jgi:hypothetical protein
MTFPVTSMAVSLMSMAAATPEGGDRAAILDAARVPVVARIGKPVLFKVDRLVVEGNWAFLRADLQDRQGRPVDYAGTPLAEAWDNGVVSKSCAVLLHRTGDGWRVVESAVGPTDVIWAGWAAAHRAPPSLFR